MTEDDTVDGETEEWPEEWSRRERNLVERVESKLGEHRDDLERRHWIQALGALGLVGAGSRELYRRDVLRALPDVRYRSESEIGEWEASWRPNRDRLPEGVSSAAGFAALVALASVGSRRRAAEQPYLSLATASLSLLQATGSVQRLVEDLRRGDVGAFSSVESILGAATVPLAIPEAARAIRNLFGN